jgi:hypothetical protein
MLSTPTFDEALSRLRGAFLEMPGVQLTLHDAAKLTGLEHDLCCAIIGALEDARFLHRRRNGSFVRRSPESPDA